MTILLLYPVDLVVFLFFILFLLLGKSSSSTRSFCRRRWSILYCFLLLASSTLVWSTGVDTVSMWYIMYLDFTVVLVRLQYCFVGDGRFVAWSNKKLDRSVATVNRTRGLKIFSLALSQLSYCDTIFFLTVKLVYLKL